MKTFDAEVRIPSPSCLRIRGSKLSDDSITKDRLAFPEKPADLDQGARIGGSASERREVGNDDIALSIIAMSFS